MGEVAGKVDKAYETKSVSELADAPIEALQGVSAADAEHLKAAFNIKTVRDLGTNKYFLWAQAISRLADDRPTSTAPRDDSQNRELQSSLARTGFDVPGFVYISGSEDEADEVVSAIRTWLSYWDATIEEVGEPELGSWRQRFALRTKSMFGNELAQETLREMTEAARSYLAEEQHANVDKIRSEAFKNVVDALNGQDEGIVVLGELIVIKQHGKVFSRPVTAVVARKIQETPGLSASPDSLLQFLSGPASLDADDDKSQEIENTPKNEVPRLE